MSEVSSEKLLCNVWTARHALREGGSVFYDRKITFIKIVRRWKGVKKCQKKRDVPCLVDSLNLRVLELSQPDFETISWKNHETFFERIFLMLTLRNLIQIHQLKELQ